MFQSVSLFCKLKRRCALGLLGLLLVNLLGCSRPLASQVMLSDAHVTGPLLVWHSWPEPESAVIHGLLNDFMRIHPRVTIVSEYVSIEQLENEFVTQNAAGLGPDMIIGADLKFIHEIVEEDLLYNLAATDVMTNMLLAHTVDALTLDDHLYGIPFAAYTNVLFYNRALVEHPVSTLDALLEEARAGLSIAIPTDFYHAYWGVRAFDGQLIDEDGKIIIDEKVAEWLHWLVDAQKDGVLLSSDYNELRRFFVEGNAAYFIGDSSELPHLQEFLGEEGVGIALLPHRAVEEDAELGMDDRLALPLAPGSFLELEVIVVNKISAQKKLAVEVIDFFVNQTHQREIAQSDFGQIPVNRTVRIDPRFSPNESVLIRQSASGVVIPLKDTEIEAALTLIGTDIFNQVLEGVLSPEDAVDLLRQGVKEQIALTESQGG